MSCSTGSIAEDALLASLHDAIRDGEPMAEYFVRAGLDEIGAIEAALARPWTETTAAEVIDDARRRILDEVQRAPLADLRQCSLGCTACCQNTGVDVTPLEAMVIASYLEKRHTADELAQLQERLWKITQRRERMPDDQRRGFRRRCGLLTNDGRCLAYEARPLACVGALSYSRSACETGLRSPDALGDTVPLDGTAKLWTMGISGGLQRALSEAGLDSNLYELHSALLRALRTPEAEQRWFRGEDIFAGCECTDAHSAPRRTEVVGSG